MKIEIDYCSRVGNTERIAYALKEYLADVPCWMVDMDLDEPSLDADVYLVGFGVRKNACPFTTLEWLEQLEGKRIVLFCTSALGSIPGYQQRLEAQIVPFLPEGSTYEGMYLCPARMTREEYEYLENQMTQNGKISNIPKLKEIYEESLAHPDQEDIAAAVKFISEKLGCI